MKNLFQSEKVFSTICSGKNVYFLTFSWKEVIPIICRLTAADRNTGVYRRAVKSHHRYYN